MTARLRHLAEVNPATPEFDALNDDDDVTFMPLETVWADSRMDTSRTRPKRDVAGGYIRFREMDVLCPKVTPTFQAGRAALVSGLAHGVGAASTEVHVVRARPGRSDPRFLRYCLLTRGFLTEGVSRFQGVAGLQRVPDEFIRDLPVADLVLPEQTRVADFLDDQVGRINSIIGARREQMLLTSEARLAHLGELVRDAGPHQRLGRVLSLGAVGVVVNPSTYFRPEGVPFVHGYNVRDGFFDLSDLKLMSAADSLALNRSRLREGDVLVVRAGYPGRAAVVTPELAGGNCASVLLLRPNAEVEPHWLAAFFNSPVGKVQIDRVQYGAAQGVINLGDVVGFQIPLPARAEQVRLLGLHQDLDQDLSEGLVRMTKQVAYLTELKQSLITAAVTGDFDASTSDGSQVGL